MNSEEKETSSSAGGPSAFSGKIFQRSSENFDSPSSKRKGTATPMFTLGDSDIPRQLSELFLPPASEEKFDKDETTSEGSRLLGDSETRGVIAPAVPPSPPTKPQTEAEKKDKNKSEENDEDSLSILDRIESGTIESDFESDNASGRSTPRSRSTDESDDNDPEREPDYTSWDDTICSTRSAYFKHYYQKNLSSLGNSRQFDGATSHNSLVSLIREKNKMSETKSKEDKKKKRKEDIGLMVLVIFLFLVLVVGISLIYHFYNLHLEELSLFKRLKFHEESRLLNLLDSEGNMDIQAHLGTTLPLYSKPEDCTHYLQYFYKYKSSPDENISSQHLIRVNKSAIDFVVKRKRRQNEFQFDDETVCLDWANQARVQIHRATSQAHVNCYNVFWSSHVAGMSLQDCMLISSPEHGVWWGIGELTGGGYPLESIENLESAPYKTGNLGKHPWGRILRRTFLSSFGGLLILPDHLPASVSVNPEKLCISVNASSLNPDPLTLNYTICSSPNVSATFEYLHHLARESKHFSPLSPKNKGTAKERILERIEYPVWIPYKQPNNEKLTQKGVMEYVDGIMSGNQSEWGHVLLPISWQEKTGDMTFDPVRFPNPKALVEFVSRKGFRLALTVSPLVSTNTKTFDNDTTNGYWVLQKGSPLPALIQYRSVSAGALIDFTNPRAAKWFASKLEDLIEQYMVDRFHLDPPDAHTIPQYHEFHQGILNADMFLQSFLKATSSVTVPLSTESIVSPPPLPTFVTVGNEESGWDSLASLVPRILTLCMLGYPLVDAGVVGGEPIRAGKVPDDKLYVRWFQAVSFLPAFQMNVLPSIYDETTQSIVADCLEKRKTMVLPRLKEAVAGTLVNNTPLIFPLGLLYPEDVDAAAVGDEWILGKDLLVAPILHKDQISRDIYIPSGLWESQLDGRLKRGPGWIRDYKVPLSDVAHFIKRYTM